MGEAYFWESQLLYFKKTAILYSAKDLFKLQDKIDFISAYSRTYTGINPPADWLKMNTVNIWKRRKTGHRIYSTFTMKLSLKLIL